jgi:shikimate kinase
MPQIGEALSHGAVTIVNAMATGKGAALGIDLWTKARVEITTEAGNIKGRNLTDPNEDTTLIETTVRRVLRKVRLYHKFGAFVETQSNIPIAVGLKSSSAASNAVALATFTALRKKVNDLETVKLGVDASLQSGVTLTGAFDDACACYFGGGVITDNKHRRILRRFKPSRRLHALVHVPNSKRYTRDVDPTEFKKISRFVLAAHREALNGNYWLSMTLNGLLYSEALGFSARPIKNALRAGAIAAGLSGKGPAVAAIAPSLKVAAILRGWRSIPGYIIHAHLNFEKAQVLRAGNWT